jgi:hypothetical protein
VRVVALLQLPSHGKELLGVWVDRIPLRKYDLRKGWKLMLPALFY